MWLAKFLLKYLWKVVHNCFVGQHNVDYRGVNTGLEVTLNRNIVPAWSIHWLLGTVHTLVPFHNSKGCSENKNKNKRIMVSTYNLERNGLKCNVILLF